MTRARRWIAETLAATGEIAHVRLLARASTTSYERKVFVLDGAATYCVFKCVFNAEYCTKPLVHPGQEHRWSLDRGLGK